VRYLIKVAYFVFAVSCREFKISTVKFGHPLYIPVLHNLQPNSVEYVADKLISSNIKLCSVSFRHNEALVSLQQMCTKYSKLISIGASTLVSESQVK